MRQVEADLVPKEGIGEEDVKPRPLLHQVLDDAHRVVLGGNSIDFFWNEKCPENWNENWNEITF